MSQELPVEYTAKNDPLACLAERYGMMPQALYNTLKATVFSAARSDAEFDALCLIAKQYNLNPITKEIYAFPSKGGGVVPLVGVDGYVSMLNRQPDFDGLEFRYADTTVAAGVAKAAPEWCECLIYRKGKSRPVIVREYLDECFRQTEPWKTHPRRMLRHKALCQAVRVAYGFSGVYSDVDEFETVTVEEAKPSINDAISAAIEAKPAPAPAQPKRRGRPPKNPAPVQPAPAPQPEPEPEPAQDMTAYNIEENYADFLFDHSLDGAKAQAVLDKMIEDGEAVNIIEAKRIFVEKGLIV